MGVCLGVCFFLLGTAASLTVVLQCMCVWGAASKLIGGTASTCIEERSDPWKGSHELRHISEKVEAFSGRVNVVRRSSRKLVGALSSALRS